MTRVPQPKPPAGVVHRAASVSEALRRLASLDGQSVLSLYLDLDLSRFPTIGERRTQADALLDDLEHEHPIDSAAPHGERMARREDLEQVRALLTDPELSPQGARGLAVFSCVQAKVLELVRLPRAVAGRAEVQIGPFVEPLVEMVAPERWGVLLISRRTARILRGTRDRLSEIADVVDDVHARHSQGGWSQARYQRGIEHEVDEHIRGACTVLLERFRVAEFERLLIGCHAEMLHRVQEHLPPDLASRFAGHFEVDVERAGPDQVRRRAVPAIEADEQRRERETIERLDETLGHGGAAAAGLDEVLDLLSDGRVATLLLAAGYAAPGFACPACDRLSSTGGRCAVDGATRVPREDVIESAIELALNRSGTVTIVRHDPDAFAAHGPIAALLRY